MNKVKDSWRPVSPANFETEVKRVASAMWPVERGGGSEIIGGTQIDAVYRTEDIAHLIECTIERSASKVREDVNKLVEARGEEEKAGRLCKCWMIVLDEPTPEQRTIAKSRVVTLLSIEEFARKLINKDEYIRLRMNHPFGSVADPVSGETGFNSVQYFPQYARDIKNGQTLKITDIVQALWNGETICLLGDFGSGKSVSIREVFKLIARQGNPSSPIPICINLREHWGQPDTSEVLLRHARILGIDSGHN